MYREIDELIEEIKKDDIFLRYRQASQSLYNEKTMALLSRHHILQEDYMRLKKYGLEGDLKDDLLEVKQEMNDNPYISEYYQTYRCFNDLLEEITKIVFSDISPEIQVERFGI